MDALRPDGARETAHNSHCPYSSVSFQISEIIMSSERNESLDNKRKVAEAVYGVMGDGNGRIEVPAEEAKHAFWDTQPVPALNATTPDDAECGPIDVVKSVDDISADPLKLPGAYKWDEIDLLEKAQVDEVYDLLSKNYVEDTDAMFRFDYSRDFIKW